MIHYPITPIFPLVLQGEGKYGYIYSDNITSILNQNLKMILLTKKGERINNLDFGAGLQNYLFEFPTGDVIESLRNESLSQINRYASYIDVNDFIVTYEDKAIIIKINYTIKENNVSGVFDLSLDNMS